MSVLRRQILTSVAATAGAAALWRCGPVLAQSAPDSEAKAPPLPALGRPLALPAVQLLDGRIFQPESAQGQVLVVYWWASWCPFCAIQSPHMERLWQTGRKQGLQMLALSIDKKPEDALAYLQKNAYSFPAGMVTPNVVKILPKPKGLPVTLVRGRDGKLVLAEAGQMFPEDIESISKFL
jgi:thiol-disulfide isomerase/thioredoxin